MRQPWMQGALRHNKVRRISGDDVACSVTCKHWQDARCDGRDRWLAVGPQGERVWPISAVESTRRREEKIIDCRTVTYLVAGRH